MAEKSIRICGFDRVPADDAKTAERMLKTADAALYPSKHDGRNRVTAARAVGEDADHTLKALYSSGGE